VLYFKQRGEKFTDAGAKNLAGILRRQLAEKNNMSGLRSSAQSAAAKNFVPFSKSWQT